MKKINFILITLFTIAVISSCKKTDPQYSLEGKWSGTYTFNAGGPASYFSMNFNSGGTLLVEANSSTSPDLANGNYTLVGDSVTGSFIYTIGIGIIYRFAGKYSSGSNVMNGTIGINPSDTDQATFSVTKQ